MIYTIKQFNFFFLNKLKRIRGSKILFKSHFHVFSINLFLLYSKNNELGIGIHSNCTPL